MVHTGSSKNWSINKINLSIANCHSCESFLTTQTKPLPAPIRNKPDRPILFLSLAPEVVDLDTGQQLTCNWGRWLVDHLSTVIRKPSDKYWYFHYLMLCDSVIPDKPLDSQCFSNCSFHGNKLIEFLTPRKIVTLGSPTTKVFNKHYKCGEPLELPHPISFLSTNNQTLEARFKLTLRMLLIDEGLYEEENS